MLCAEGSRALPRSRFRNRKPAGLRNPRRGGLLGAQTELFTWRFRECALPGVEVAQAFSARRRGPRAPMPRFARHGYLVAGVVGGPNPACGPHAKKSLRPQPQKTAPAGAVPA